MQFKRFSNKENLKKDLQIPIQANVAQQWPTSATINSNSQYLGGMKTTATANHSGLSSSSLSSSAFSNYFGSIVSSAHLVSTVSNVLTQFPTRVNECLSGDSGATEFLLREVLKRLASNESLIDVSQEISNQLRDLKAYYERNPW